MIKQTKRKENSQSLFAKFWNEFLFAREFEYETPLTPNEIADALKTIEDQEHKAWFLSHSKLVHKMSYDRAGDKSGDFLIELESENRHKWWETNSAVQQVEGTISADPDTGLTTVRGRTLFNRKYYLMILMMFVFNFLAQSMDGAIIFTTVWMLIIIAFWYNMYRERNKLADRVDEIIMNAKSELSMAHLLEEDHNRDLLEAENVVHHKAYL